MKKTVIVYGLIAGVIVSAFMATSMAICYKNPAIIIGNTGMIVGYLAMLIGFSMIFVAIKNYRDKYNNGFISFGRAFKIGFLISLIASTIYVLVWGIEFNFFMPDFMERYIGHIEQQARTSANSAELQREAAEMAKYKDMYKNPVFFALFTYAEILPVGLLVTLVSALILRRRNKQQAVAMA
jgi:hypothetical protein